MVTMRSASPPARPAIVVGLDGSADGLHALDWAVDLATRRGWLIRGMHVVDKNRPLHPLAGTPDRDDGTDVLDDAADELERLGFHDAALETACGNPAQALLEVSHEAASLVIGRRGTGGFAELAVGSVSQVCAALARTALVVVPDTWKPAEPARGQIVIGVDGSHSCQAALGYAFEMAAERGAELTLIHAPDVPEAFPRHDLWLDPEHSPWQRDGRVLVGEALTGWPEKYPEVVFRTRCPEGHPVQVLAKESKYADLVVVGGRGRTEFTELRLGSVARGLLHHAHCPIAIIHSG